MAILRYQCRLITHGDDKEIRSEVDTPVPRMRSEGAKRQISGTIRIPEWLPMLAPRRHGHPTVPSRLITRGDEKEIRSEVDSPVPRVRSEGASVTVACRIRIPAGAGYVP